MDRYTIRKWRGHDTHVCTRCKHSTLDRLEAERHWEREHAPPPTRQRPTGILDATGAPVTVEEPDEQAIRQLDEVQVLIDTPLDRLEAALQQVEDLTVLELAAAADVRKGAQPAYENRTKQLHETPGGQE